VKLKRLNAETFEMVVVVNSSKQTFKVYGKDQSGIAGIVEDMKAEGWNVQATMDLSHSSAL
jgi:phenylpyruvate tautomerase PptA (4-oxalocrotonate tautomerase family)